MAPGPRLSPLLEPTLKTLETELSRLDVRNEKGVLWDYAESRLLWVVS